MKTNNNIKTIIIDDESHWQMIVKKLVSRVPELTLEAVFSEVEEAYDFLMDNEIELIFLDVQIKGDNGIDFIKRLKKTHTVIIISSFSDFALESYSISAIDYLMKPLDFDKFEQAVQKAIQSIRLGEAISSSRKIISFDRDYFLIKENQSTLKINHSDVIYITAVENYIKIITRSKTYMVLTTLLQFERSINNHPFLRIHRSYIINLNCLKTLNKDSCILLNNTEIPIGDIYRNDIQEIFVEGRLIKR
jgi:DNA-binding LytR/AlgR family response regulator